MVWCGERIAVTLWCEARERHTHKEEQKRQAGGWKLGNEEMKREGKQRGKRKSSRITSVLFIEIVRRRRRIEER